MGTGAADSQYSSGDDTNHTFSLGGSVTDTVADPAMSNQDQAEVVHLEEAMWREEDSHRPVPNPGLGSLFQSERPDARRQHYPSDL